MHRRALLALLPAALAAACTGPTGTALTRADRRALRIASFRVNPVGGNYRNGGSEFRNRIVVDLAEALRREFSDREDPSGWTMQAEIGVLDVVGGTATATGRGQSQLSATLRLIDQRGALRASIPLTVTAGAARETLTGTAIGAITGGRDRFYDDLLEAYARDARILVLGEDLPGERLVRRARDL
jgi:ABC-type amino acid transport substrate-binding protein